MRLRKAFELGKCVLTVGTGKVLDDFLEGAGLVPSHNYAVLGKFRSLCNRLLEADLLLVVDMRERNGVREVEVINPWPNSRSTWSNDLRSSLPGDRGEPSTTVSLSIYC